MDDVLLRLGDRLLIGWGFAGFIGVVPVDELVAGAYSGHEVASVGLAVGIAVVVNHLQHGACLSGPALQRRPLIEPLNTYLRSSPERHTLFIGAPTEAMHDI